jgi:hypothetical protein
MVGYISSLAGKDLEITQGTNGNLKVSFEYNKEIELFKPVYLLIKYRSSATGGV